MRKMGRLLLKTVLICTLLLGLTITVQAASFDCAKATTKIEKMICADPELSKLDEEMSKIYKTAQQDEKQAESIRQTQKQWMKVRNSCTDAACVKRAYEMRLSSLTVKQTAIDNGVVATQKVAPSTQGGSWTYRGGAGRNEPLCHELLRRLNRYDQDESLGNRCSFPVLASHPKFSAPPWEELDLRQHEELFVKLIKYSDEGPAGYFQLRPGLKQQNPDSYYQYRAKLLIEEGGRLRVWRTRLVNHYGSGPIIPAPPGDQAIVQMYIPMSKEIQATYCAGKPKPANVNGLDLLFIVTPDLSGPDPNIDPGTLGILGGSDLVIYEGKPLLVSGEDVWRDGELMLNRLCNFEFVERRK